MKKRTWLASIALVSAFCLCPCFAACGEHEHTFTDYVYNNDATCTADGTETAHCSHEGCSETDTRTKADTKLGHSMTYHPGTATCSAAGTLDYWRCSRCEKDFSDENGWSEMTVYETDSPIDHTYTAANQCIHFETCGAEWEYTEGLEYELDPQTNTYTVTGIGTASGDIVIPYGYQGISVTSIKESAFRNCTKITGLTIPGSVTRIKYWAFDGCKNLASITIPDSVTSIEEHTFTNTAYYNDVSHWENGEVLYIGNHVIDAKNTISGAYSIRPGTKTIGGSAFQGLENLTGITIPDSVISIGNGAFGECSGLTSIAIPDSVTEIGTNAFEFCSGLTSIEIPDGVTKIGKFAIRDCSNLKSIIIPDSVTEIGDSALWNCEKLADIQFKGTMQRWKAIKKGEEWDKFTLNYTVTCTDGKISKNDAAE